MAALEARFPFFFHMGRSHDGGATFPSPWENCWCHQMASSLPFSTFRLSGVMGCGSRPEFADPSRCPSHVLTLLGGLEVATRLARGLLLEPGDGVVRLMRRSTGRTLEEVSKLKLQGDYGLIDKSKWMCEGQCCFGPLWPRRLTNTKALF